MAERQTTTLGALCDAIVDCEHKTSPIDESGSYFAVGTPAMSGNKINYGEARRISRDTFEEWTRRLRPQAGDLLLAREAPVGPVVRIPTEANVAPGQRTVLLRPADARTDSTFLYYLLASDTQQARMHSMAEGSTVAHLNVADVRSLEVPLPPSMPEQRAIAEVLGALDDKIAANTRLAQSHAELAQQFYETAASTAPLTCVSLDDLVSTQYGLTTSASSGNGPRLLRVTDINKKPWIEWEGVPGCTPSDGELAKYRTEPGDILVARMADPGKAAFIDAGDPVAVFASYLVRLKPRDPKLGLFVYYFLRSAAYRSYAESATTGSVQRNMNARVIVGTAISVPSDDLLRQFNSRISSLRGSLRAVLVENRTLAATRDALLPALMSGKLRVRDAERFAEAHA